LKFLSAQETPWVVRPNSTHRVAVLIAASQLLTATIRPAWRGWSTEARHRVGWRGGEIAKRRRDTELTINQAMIIMARQGGRRNAIR
jgi:hypothetical protein